MHLNPHGENSLNSRTSCQLVIFSFTDQGPLSPPLRKRALLAHGETASKDTKRSEEEQGTKRSEEQLRSIAPPWCSSTSPRLRIIATVVIQAVLTRTLCEIPEDLFGARVDLCR